MGAGEGGGIAADNAEAARGSREITINDRTVEVHGAVALGRQIRAAGGFAPEAEWVLIRLLRQGTRSIGLDEPVDLRHDGPWVFRAFKSDRVFTFTLDGHGFEWGEPVIGEAELRRIADVPDGKAIFIERAGQPPIEVEEDGEVRLDGAGAERLVTRKAEVEVFLDDVPKRIPRGVYTTEQLVAALGVEAGYVLDLVTVDGRLEALKPGQKTRVRKGMRFISQAPCGGSS